MAASKTTLQSTSTSWVRKTTSEAHSHQSLVRAACHDRGAERHQELAILTLQPTSAKLGCASPRAAVCARAASCAGGGSLSAQAGVCPRRTHAAAGCRPQPSSFEEATPWRVAPDGHASNAHANGTSAQSGFGGALGTLNRSASPGTTATPAREGQNTSGPSRGETRYFCCCFRAKIE